MNRIYSNIALAKNIPFAEIQFGLYDTTSVEWNFCQSKKVVVWGSYFSSLFEKEFLIPKRNIVVLGSPRFDYLLKHKDSNSSNDKRVKKKKVLFASMYSSISSYDDNYNPDLIEDFKKMVVKVALNCKEVLLYVKPHPLENLDWLSINYLDNIIVIEKSKDIKEYISMADVFLTFGSTSTFDALLQDKIVVLANTPNLVWWDDIFLKNDAGLKIHSEVELTEMFDALVDDYEGLARKAKIKSTGFLQNKIQITKDSSSTRIINYFLKN